MSRSDNWVPIDKNISQEFRNIDREFSRIEALVSHSINVNCGCSWSISGYAKRWKWSRNKVRKFVREIGTEEGHLVDSRGTVYRHPVHLINTGLRAGKDRQGTEEGQNGDRGEDTIIKTKIKTNKKNIVELNKTRPHTPFKSIVDYLNSSVGSSFKHTTKPTQAKIKARFNEGFTFDDFTAVIDFKTDEWKSNDEYRVYLRPETLFGPKFEAYLQAAKAGNPSTKGKFGTWKRKNS